MKSSRFAVEEPGQATKNEWSVSDAAYIQVELLWKALVGDVPCDVVKIDIEGSEVDFVSGDNPFLRRCRRVVIECHKWVEAPSVVEGRLAELGFVHRGTLRETDAVRLTWHARQQ